MLRCPEKFFPYPVYVFGSFISVPNNIGPMSISYTFSVNCCNRSKHVLSLFFVPSLRTDSKYFVVFYYALFRFKNLLTAPLSILLKSNLNLFHYTDRLSPLGFFDFLLIVGFRFYQKFGRIRKYQMHFQQGYQAL